MGNEAGIPLMQQPMDPLCRELPELLLEPLNHHGLDIFISPKSKALLHCVVGTEHKKIT
jgi:hypothetical protein